MPKLLIFAAFVLLVAILAPPALAAQSSPSAVLLFDLPPVYLLPDSPFYFLKTLWEWGRLVWVRTPELRAQLHLYLAQTRLSEAAKMSEKGEGLVVEKLMVEYDNHLSRAKETMDKAQTVSGEAQALWERLRLVKDVASVIATPSARSSRPRRSFLKLFDILTPRSSEPVSPLAE